MPDIRHQHRKRRWEFIKEHKTIQKRGTNMKIKTMILTMTMVLLTACTKADTTNKRLETILQKKELVVVTSPDFAPYEFIDANKAGQDKYVGADIELAKYIAQALGVTLRIDPMDFDNVLASITQGRADLAISGLGYKADRAETMELSIPYNISEDNCHGLLIRNDQLDLYQTLDAFKGKKVAAQNASLQQDYASSQIPDIQMELISSLQDGILMLQTKKVDALATTCKTGEQFALSYPALAMAEAKFVVTDDSGTVIGITKHETALLEKINEIIQEVIDQGLYVKWEAEYTEYASSLGVE